MANRIQGKRDLEKGISCAASSGMFVSKSIGNCNVENIVCCFFTLILLFGVSGNGISPLRAPISQSCGAECASDWSAMPAPQLMIP